MSYFLGLLKPGIVKNEIDRILLIAFFFALPFERIPSVQLRNITLRASLVIGAFLILRAAWLLYKQKKTIRFDLPVKLLGLFLVWAAILLPFSINLARGITVYVFTCFTVFVALAIKVIFEKKFLGDILRSLIISSAIIIIFCVYQYVGNILGLPNWLTGLRDRYSWQQFGFPRVQGTSLEPLYLASYLLLPFSILFAAVATNTNLIPRRVFKLSLVLLVGLSAAIFMTVSRGGVFAGIASIFSTVVFGLILKKVNSLRAAKAVAIVVTGVFIGFIFITFLNKTPENFLLTNGKKGNNALANQLTKTGLEGSGDERSQVRGLAIDILKTSQKNLIIGIGPGQFGPYVQPDKSSQSDGWWIVNNETLELLVEYGIIGLMLFLAFITSLLYRLWKTISGKDPVVATAALGLMGYIIAEGIQYQTFSTLYIVHIWAAIGLGLALIDHGHTTKRG